MTPLLSVRGLVAGYDNVEVLHGLSFDVSEGELVTIVGANGAGKSTLLKAITGMLHAFAGSVVLEGADITRWSPPRVVGAGVVHVPENRRIFAASSVEENLRLASYPRRLGRGAFGEELAGIFEMFPILEERREQAAGSLSGGEQQMLAISMGLMAKPRLLALDEPSLGLAPILTDRLFAEIKELHRRGTTILLVEQLAERALSIADRGLVLKLGRIVGSGDAGELSANPVIREAYLGTG